MATPRASWLFQVSANAATHCLMAAVSASRLAAICAREPVAENVRNRKTASAAFDWTEIIADSYCSEFKIRAGPDRNPADCRHHTTNAPGLAPVKLPGYGRRV